jgi:membrane-associated HD superfamily phosphohydrolase
MTLFFRVAEFTAMQNVKAPLNDPTLWSYAIPFAFGSLLMTLLADRRIALFTGIFLALIAGLIAPKSLEFALFAVIASAVAVYGIGRYRSRFVGDDGGRTRRLWRAPRPPSRFWLTRSSRLS